MKKKPLDLGCGCLGNGVSVWNRAKEEHGDYQKIAHIAPDKTVTLYVKATPEILTYIDEVIASNPSLSVCQKQKVFINKEKKK